jgi:hypothetical protein
MSTAINLVSYQKFRDWMKEFQLDQDETAVKGRWDAIGTLTDEIEDDELEALIRLVLKTRQIPASAAVDKFVSHFAKGGPFSARENERELQVLSAIALLNIASDSQNYLAEKAALTILTSLVGGARKPRLPFDLLVLGTAAAGALSIGAGRRPSSPTLQAPTHVNFEAVAKALGENDWTAAATSIKTSGTAVDGAIQLLATRTKDALEVFSSILQQQDEELQMLWWLLGGRSEDLDLPFDAISGDKQALVLAKELADHTKLLPGPPSIKALLSKAGLKSRGKIEIVSAINGCDGKWLNPLVDGFEISPVLHPIHFGIKRRLEVEDGAEWVANWSAVTGLKADIAFIPLNLGELFYREQLLLQAE